MLRTTDIFLTDNVVRLVTEASFTSARSWNEDYPIVFMKSDCDPLELGTCVVEALNRFEILDFGPQSSDEWKVKIKRYVEAMDVKNWKKFLKSGTKSVRVYYDDVLVEIVPKKNFVQLGIRGEGDFGCIDEKTRRCSLDPYEVGKAVFAAFEDCE